MTTPQTQYSYAVLRSLLCLFPSHGFCTGTCHPHMLFLCQTISHFSLALVQYTLPLNTVKLAALRCMPALRGAYGDTAALAVSLYVQLPEERSSKETNWLATSVATTPSARHLAVGSSWPKERQAIQNTSPGRAEQKHNSSSRFQEGWLHVHVASYEEHKKTSRL